APRRLPGRALRRVGRPRPHRVRAVGPRPERRERDRHGSRDGDAAGAPSVPRLRDPVGPLQLTPSTGRVPGRLSGPRLLNDEGAPPGPAQGSCAERRRSLSRGAASVTPSRSREGRAVATDRTGPGDPAGEEPGVSVVGAGPAGLTAAYVLARRGVPSTVLESDTVVGGISRTTSRDGWRFDVGGHRFFTKVKPVEDLWHEILGPDDFLRRPRLSRIYYRGKFYDYPISAMNALRNLGPIEAVRCVASSLWVRVHPPKDKTTLEGFVASRFGWRLYRHFFKTQSEKVWGVPCTEIQADWGAQRIKNLSLFRAVWEALKPKSFRRKKDKSKQVTSLIEEFNYPKYGPGMMWERATELVTARGTKVVFGSAVTKIEVRDGKAVAVTAETDGAPTRYECTHVISSMPI